MKRYLFPVIVLVISAQSSLAGHVLTWPAPEGEPASPDYEVLVNGTPVFCYTSYQFADNLKGDEPVTMAGRPVSPVSFCSFDFSGEVEVEVRMLDNLRRAGVRTDGIVVRPLSLGIRPVVKSDRFCFRVDKPCQLSIEPGGSLQHPLHIFANPPETHIPRKNDPKVRYFGPGVHNVRDLSLNSGETLYIAGGAVVNLALEESSKLGKPEMLYGQELFTTGPLCDTNGKKDVTIRGRGILCGRKALEKNQRGELLRLSFIDNLKVEGVILRESSAWSLNIINCRGVHVDNVKVVGHYVGNDGIVIGGSSDALVENSFCHNADDSFEVKVWVPQRNVEFRNCIAWNDVGCAFGLCCESKANLSDVIYKDCTVIHATHPTTSRGAIGISLEGDGMVNNFRFENIVIEDVAGSLQPPLKVINNWDSPFMNLPAKPGEPYEQAKPPDRQTPRGNIRATVFKNVTVLKSECPDAVVMADGPRSEISGVTFDNVVINGRKLAPRDPRINTNAWVRDVLVK